MQHWMRRWKESGKDSQILFDSNHHNNKSLLSYFFLFLSPSHSNPIIPLYVLSFLYLPSLPLMPVFSFRRPIAICWLTEAYGASCAQPWMCNLGAFSFACSRFFNSALKSGYFCPGSERISFFGLCWLNEQSPTCVERKPWQSGTCADETNGFVQCE